MLIDADESLVARLAESLPALDLAPAPPRYLEEPRERWKARASWLARPSHTAEVADLVRFCSTHHVGIVPFGGGTGLVGGQIAADGPLALLVSLERMNAIRSIHRGDDAIVVEAGATVAEVQAAAAEVDRLFPLSYASEGTATIGGALAVNSGGLNVLRYGMARDLCLGIEAVLPDGSVLHGLKRLRKDNTGYDLRHLLIGSEGTLAIITAAAFALHPRPERTATAFLSVASPQAALDLFGEVRRMAGETVSAFELVSGTGLRFLADAFPDLQQPFDGIPAWSVLVELGTGASLDPQAMLLSLFEDAARSGLVLDGVLAQSEAQRRRLWAVRERIPEANRSVGAIASHDVSLPLADIPGFVEETGHDIAESGPYRINCFGHLGDGNLHYNIFPPPGRDRDAFRTEAEALTRLIHDAVVRRGGSFSAEHGIGRLKVGELRRYGDPARLAAMRKIKTALDPKGIMNPGSVLATEPASS